MRYTVDDAFLIRRLTELGWLPENRPTTPDQLDSVLREYQGWHGLRTDGWAGPVTERSLHATRFCSTPERARRGGSICKWPMQRVTWAVESTLPRLSRDDQLAAFAQSWAAWSRVCGLQAEYTGNTRTANVVITAGRIDGNNGTLAWSELPCGAREDSQLQQKYDSDESFVIEASPRGYYVDLVAVATHEIGHAKGIDHLAAGNLMAPTYDPRIRTPQAGDIAEAVKRYGQPINPEPDPEPIPNGEKIMVPADLVHLLQLEGHRVTRLP